MDGVPVASFLGRDLEWHRVGLEGVDPLPNVPLAGRRPMTLEERGSMAAGADPRSADWYVLRRSAMGF